MEALAIGYGENVLKSSLGKLGSILLSEACLVVSVREDIRFIRDELLSMDAVLQDLIWAGSLNRQDKVWMLHVLQVACDAELCMDEFAGCLGRPGVNGAARRASHYVRTVIPRWRIAKMIQELKIRVMEVSQRRSRYTITVATNLPDSNEITRRADKAQQNEMHYSHWTHSDDALVGTESNFDQLLKYMEDNSFKVIAIVGPAGSGKTALAKKLYRRRHEYNPHKSIQTSAWVTLSKKPNKKWVLEDLLMQLNPSQEGMEKDDSDEGRNLLEILKNRLTARRFLLVLDACTQGALNELKEVSTALKALPDNVAGTIVLTAREIDVAKSFCSDENHIKYHIINLNFKDELLKELCDMMVLNLTTKWYKSLKPIIKCFASVLSIVTVTSIVTVLTVSKLLQFAQPVSQDAKTNRNSQNKKTQPPQEPNDHNSCSKETQTHPESDDHNSPGGEIQLPQASDDRDSPSEETPPQQESDDHISPVEETPPHNESSSHNSPGEETQLHEESGSRDSPGEETQPEESGSCDSPGEETQPEESGSRNSPGEETQPPPESYQNIAKTVFQIITVISLFVMFYLYKKVLTPLLRLSYFRRIILKGAPYKRAHTYFKLKNVKEKIFLSLPLAVKFVSGALIGESMDSNKFNDCIKGLIGLSENKPEHEAQQPHPKPEDMEKKLMEVIKCCHQILNPTLKRCAEDLNILPEGYTINRKKLMRRWVALDLVSPAPGLSREEVAEIYFDELMARGFIEPESMDSCGKIKSCKINSMFKEYLTNYNKNSNTSIRLYDIQPSSALERVKQIPKPSRLFLTTSKLGCWNRNNKELFPNYSPKSLTMLDLEGCKGLKEKHLSFLHRYTNLRFLSLRNTDLTKLPKKTRKLLKLEILDIRQTKIKKVPYLPNLKHLLAGCIQKPESGQGDLKLSTSSIEVPVGLEQMSSLQTLAYVNATKASNLLVSVRELSQMRKLGLVICDTKLNTKPLCISLMMLSASLLSLSVFDEREDNSLEFLEYMICFPPLKLRSLTLRGYLGRVPQWVAKHKCLSKLSFMDTHLKSDAIRLIGKIPTLLCLKLYHNSFEEDDLELKNKEFPVLRLLIVHCHTIKKMLFAKGTASRLEVFRWVFSKAQPGELLGIDKLPTLKEVSLIGDVNLELQKNIYEAVKIHPNHVSMKTIEKQEKKSV